MKRKLILASLVAALSPLSSQAAELEISVTNLTGGIFFTPLLIVAHPAAAHLFQAGQAAGAAVQAMAEGGDTAALKTAGGQTIANPAGGLLGPALGTQAMLSTTADNTRRSLTAMMLPTNDGFVGLDGWEIPGAPGGGEGRNEIRLHAGVVSVDDGLATSVLKSNHRFDNPVMSVLIERIR